MGSTLIYLPVIKEIYFGWERLKITNVHLESVGVSYDFFRETKIVNVMIPIGIIEY